MTPTIRPETAADHEAVRHVHRRAFGRDDEAALVDALRAGGHARLSLVAECDGRVVGHVLFGDLSILTAADTVPAVSLAPLAVLPEWQRRGVGSALVEHGLATCREAGHRLCVVLGHPAYYPRFGFSAKSAARLASPFAAGEAWMAAELVAGAAVGVEGWVQYPPPFRIGPFARPAFPADRAEWVRMRTALWPDGADDHAGEVEAHFAAGPVDQAAFVAVRPAGGLCGFVEVSVRPVADGCGPGPVGYLEGWFVDPDVRRQGVGRMLVAVAERWATARGCREMASDALLENAVSHAAHRAIGFEETERLVHFRKQLADSPEGTPDPPRLILLGVAGTFAVCKLLPGSAIPPWATAGDLFTVSRTADELSVVCRQEAVPEGTHCERGWRCLRVAGAMPFTLVGVLAALTTPVAGAGVGVFAFSTFDTDYLLVKEADLPKAVAALRAAGHAVEAAQP